MPAVIQEVAPGCREQHYEAMVDDGVASSQLSYVLITDPYGQRSDGAKLFSKM